MNGAKTMSASFHAALMSAESGGSQVYDFTADSGLFRKPAKHIVKIFMEFLSTQQDWHRPPTYKINSVVKKTKKQVVMATGSLVLAKGELPFLLMISPGNRVAGQAA
jgi:hypothetical protein